MRDTVLFILCILVTGFIGWNVLYVLSGRKGLSSLYTAEMLGFSYLLGIGIISMQMFVMGLFGIKFTTIAILLPWVPLVVINAKRMSLRMPRLLLVPPRDFALIALIALQTGYNFFRALIKPIESYDAVAIYGLKSKIMYLAGGISGDFFRNVTSNFHGAHADYPLLIPLSTTWVYTFLGSFNEILVKALFPLFYMSLIFIFYGIMKRITKNRSFSLLFTFLLASIKQVSDYSTIAVADLALGIYFAVSLLYLYLWFRERGKSVFLNLSLTGSLLMIWTKNEGTALVFITLFILLVYTLSNRQNFKKKEIAHVFFYAFAAILMLAGWAAFKNWRGLVNENFNLSMINPKNLIAHIKTLPAILYGYQKEFFGLKKWNIFWIISIAVFAWQFKKIFSGYIKYITCAIILFFIGYFSMYLFSAAVEIRYFVRVTASRFLLHIFPVVMFWLAVITHEQKLIDE